MNTFLEGNLLVSFMKFEGHHIIQTYSSGARTNCIVFVANSAIHSSIELSVTASYALLNNAMRMFKRILVLSANGISRVADDGHHDHKSVYVIQDQTERRSEVLEPTEIWRLHDAVRHGLDNKCRHLSSPLDLIQAIIFRQPPLRSANRAVLRTSTHPINAWRKPIQTTTSREKKIKLSFIITFKTTSIAPKKRNVSRYSSKRSQNIGAVKARKL